MKPEIGKTYYEYKMANNKTEHIDTVKVSFVHPSTEQFLEQDIRVWFCRVEDSQGCKRRTWIDGNDLVETGEGQ